MRGLPSGWQPRDAPPLPHHPKTEVPARMCEGVSGGNAGSPRIKPEGGPRERGPSGTLPHSPQATTHLVVSGLLLIGH